MSVETPELLLRATGFAPDVSFQLDDRVEQVEWNTMTNRASFLIEFPNQPKKADLLFSIREPVFQQDLDNPEEYTFIVENYSLMDVMVYSQENPSAIKLQKQSLLAFGDIFKVGLDYYQILLDKGDNNRVTLGSLDAESAENLITNKFRMNLYA